MSHLSVAGLTHLKISKEFLEHFMPQGDRPLGRLGTESAGLTLTLYYLSKVKQPNLKTISNLAFLYQSKQIQNRYNDFITSFYGHMNSSAYKHPIWITQDRINPKRKTMCISQKEISFRMSGQSGVTLKCQQCGIFLFLCPREIYLEIIKLMYDYDYEFKTAGHNSGRQQ